MQVSMSTLDIDVAESACARPWVGRSFFVQPRAQAARCFVAETGEERLWRALVPGLFAPGPHASRWSRAVRHVLVVPLAHVTFLNLDYQIYLNQVMHTSAGAWLGHLLLIPLNVALLFYALTVHVGSGAALVLLAALATWYVAMAARWRSGLWAGAALVVLLGVAQLGCTAATWVMARDGGVPWYLQPIALMFAVSLAQACSHLFEDNIPPRANFEQHWIPKHSFVWGDSWATRLRGLLWAPIGLLWGALDEWWASAKLLPIYVLELLWLCGHQPQQRRAIRARTITALASGDPALDFVGTGGGSSVAALGRTYVLPDRYCVTSLPAAGVVGGG